MATATSGFGVTLKRGSGSGTPETFAAIAAVKDITPPSLSADTIDVTTHSSPDGFKEFIAGLRDGGEVTFSLMFDPDDTGHIALTSDLSAGSKRNWKLEFPDAIATWSFAGIVTKFQPKSPLDGALTADCTIKVSGKPELA